MSFVLRRFAGAGLVPSAGEEGAQGEGDARQERGPETTTSGVERRMPVVLVVGVDDDVARTTTAFAVELGVGLVRATQGAAACRQIREVRPTVVGLAHSLWRDEKAAIADAAREAGARVVELPPFAPQDWIAKRLVRAAMDDALLAAAG